MIKTTNNINSILDEFNSGKKQKALNKLNLLLKTNKQNIDLLLLHAKIHINLEQIDNANQSLTKILEINPKNKIALELSYINYLKINNYELANKYIDRLLNIGNHKYELLRDKAYIEYLNNNFQESEEFIKKALIINKNEEFGLNILGLINIEQGKTLEAVKLFEKAILTNPKYADSYNNLGKCLIDIEDLNQAYIYFKKAYRINPHSDLPLINIANILSMKDKNKLAIKFYEKAKKINPQNKIIDKNIVIINCKLKNFDWVEKNLKKQKNLDSEIVLGYSYLLLNKKRFNEAFKLFDFRLKTKDFPKKNLNHKIIFDKLNFQEKLEKNNKILIIKEQGVGDEILFSSIYNDLLNKFSNVKIECDKRLVEIFNRSFKKNIFFQFGHFSSSKNTIKNFDNVIYAGSLTKYFRKNEVDFKKKPFLITLEDKDNKFRKKLQIFKNTKKIGISWKSVVNIYGSLKSIKITDFTKIISKDRTIINLQYGNTNEEIKAFNKNENKIYNFENIDLFNDFESLISILKNLDVLVTVSNSTAHFAGALGVPTVLICPKKSSTYYYWDYEEGKTPWYESISIVRFKNSTNYTMNLVNDLIERI